MIALAPLPDVRPWTAGIVYDHSDERLHMAHGRPVVSVTQGLRLAGKTADFAQVDPNTLALKATIGRAVHDATHYHDEGDLSNEDQLQREIEFGDRIVPGPWHYLQGWKLFCRERRFRPLLLETVVFSHAYRFIGRLDRVGRVDGRLTVVLDIKIGDPEAAAAHLQLSAYEQALTEELPELADHSLQRWSVQLLPSGTYRVRPYPKPPRNKRTDRAEMLMAMRDARVLLGQQTAA